MREAPIGVFDSGVGGLTVLKALAAELPHEHFVYLGDTARLPYGTKSLETVARYAVQAAEALAGYGVKCLVIACNTASSVGLPAVRERIRGVPIVGVIEPGAEAACAASLSGHIAVIATEGTVRGGAYQEAILRLRAHARVIAKPTQLFVALAEEGLHEGPIADSIAHHYLDPIFGNAHFAKSHVATSRRDVSAARATASHRDATAVRATASHRDTSAARATAAYRDTALPPDTLVLGCTHFPMLARAIRAAVGPDIKIVDSAATTAKAVRETLEREGLTRRAATDTTPESRGVTTTPRATGTPVTTSTSVTTSMPLGPRGTTRFLATDSIERFARIGSHFLERPIAPEEVELIDL